MRYTSDLGCRTRGIPHDFTGIHETMRVKWEVCQICGKKMRWNKGYRGRMDNVEYLKAHVRNYCQKTGATKRVYNRIYNPEKCIIIL